MARSHTSRTAFTLVELLVVIAIFSVLMAVLLPVLHKTHEASRVAVCLTNQRQLALATISYQGDYRGALPQPDQDADIADTTGSTTSAAAKQMQGSALWFNALDFYLQQQALSYSSSSTANRNYLAFKQDPVWLTFPTGGNVQQNNRTIKMNSFLGDAASTALPNNPGGVKFFRHDDIKRPSLTVLFVDGRGSDTPSTTTGNTDPTSFSAEEVDAGLRHPNYAANVMLLDAHGETAVQPIRLSSGYQGWYNGSNGGTQKYIWLHLGRNGVNDDY